MARVIQRRPGPPYLLILFVFLFLVSTTLAVLFYTRQDEAREKAAEAEANLKKLADAADQREPFVVERTKEPAEVRKAEAKPDFDSASDEVAWAKTQSVVYRLQRHLTDLSERVMAPRAKTSDPIGAYIAATDEVGDAQKLAKQRKVEEILGKEFLAAQPEPVAGEWSGILKEIEAGYLKFDAQREVGTALLKALEEAKKDISARETRISKLDSDLGAKTAEAQGLANQLAQSQEKARTLEQDLRAASDLAAGRKTDLDAVTKRLADATDRGNALAKEKENLLKIVERQKVEKKVSDIRAQWELRTRQDGKIVKVTPAQDQVYIDRGMRDGIQPDMTFAVYPKTGIPIPPKSKGKIRVIRVDEASSLCRITERDEKSPIDADDVIANLAYDAHRKYTFVVEGAFDLYGSGQPTAVGRQEVLLLVQKFGGVVTDRVDVDVDFVILGEPPKKPELPEEAVGPERERYEQERAAFERYERVKQEAMKINSIQILNTNRFLDLVGYMPARTHALR